MTIKGLFYIIVPDEYASLPIIVEDVPLLPNKDVDVSKLNGEYSMSFKALDDDETQKYATCSDKGKFQGSSESIHVWNLEIKKYFHIVKKYDTAYHLIKDRLSIYSNELPMEYLYISHMILHEVGHYKQYLDKNRKVYTYLNQYRKEHKIIYEQQNQCYLFLQTEMEFETITPEKLVMYNNKMDELAKKYREIPDEKNADQFADKHMKNAIEKIKAFLEKEKQVNSD